MSEGCYVFIDVYLEKPAKSPSFQVGVRASDRFPIVLVLFRERVFRVGFWAEAAGHGQSSRECRGEARG